MCIFCHDPVSPSYLGRFATTTARTSGPQRGRGYQKSINHSIFGPSDKSFDYVLLASCKHCWIYFSTPLALYIFRRSKNGGILWLCTTSHTMCMIETKLRDERSMTQMNKIEVSTITLVDPLTNGLVKLCLNCNAQALFDLLFDTLEIVHFQKVENRVTIYVQKTLQCAWSRQGLEMNAAAVSAPFTSIYKHIYARTEGAGALNCNYACFSYGDSFVWGWNCIFRMSGGKHGFLVIVSFASPAPWKGPLSSLRLNTCCVLAS